MQHHNMLRTKKKKQQQIYVILETIRIYVFTVKLGWEATLVTADRKAHNSDTLWKKSVTALLQSQHTKEIQKKCFFLYDLSKLYMQDILCRVALL